MTTNQQSKRSNESLNSSETKSKSENYSNNVSLADSFFSIFGFKRVTKIDTENTCDTGCASQTGSRL